MPSSDPAGMPLSMLFDVFALGQRVRTLLATAMDGAELRPDEYATYSVLFEAGNLTLTELARTLGMPITTAADYVRSMRERGHLRREPHPRDSRAQLLALTPAGVRAHRRAAVLFDRAYQALLRELPPLDEATTRTVLQQLTASVARATALLVHRPTPSHRP